jgi:lipopolysaccharide export system permease protein
MRSLLVGLNLGIGEFLMALFYMSPLFMLMVIPLSCMLSVFLTILRMSSDRELIALKSSGVSVFQLLPAPMWFAVICYAATMWISLFGIAWGTDHFRTTVLQMARDKAQLNLQPGVFNQDISGFTMFARQVDPRTNEMRQVIVEDTSTSDGTRITILAPTGIVVTDNKMGELVFSLNNGRMYKLNKDNVNILDFDEYNIRISLERLFSGIHLGEIRPKEMSLEELLRIMSEQNPDTLRRFDRKVQIEVQKRLALPISCLVLALFAIPMAVSFEGVRQQFGVVMVLLAFLAYYSMYSLGITLSESGRLHPVAAVWTPNIFFLIAGIGGLILASREGVPAFTMLAQSAIHKFGNRITKKV